MKIGIVTANYGRPSILKLWCASIKRLNDTFGGIHAIVTSETTDYDTCYKYGVEHITRKQNKPVSKKFNISMQAMAQYDMDYVMVLGSDDIMTNELFGEILKATEKGYDVIGIDEIFFYSLNRHMSPCKLIKTTHKRMLGVAKTIKADILEKVNYTPWHNDRNYGLDADLSNIIRPHISLTRTVEGMVTDVKGDMSMNRFSFWNNKEHEEYEEDHFLTALSQEERDIINEIKERVL